MTLPPAPITFGSVARLGVDGALDHTFPITQFYDSDYDTSFPHVAALQSDDSIIVGGTFYYVGDDSGESTSKRNGVARLTADGLFDPSFDIGDSGTPQWADRHCRGGAAGPQHFDRR